MFGLGPFFVAFNGLTYPDREIDRGIEEISEILLKRPSAGADRENRSGLGLVRWRSSAHSSERIAGIFHVGDDGLVTLWRDYFDLNTYMTQMKELGAHG